MVSSTTVRVSMRFLGAIDEKTIVREGLGLVGGLRKGPIATRLVTLTLSRPRSNRFRAMILGCTGFCLRIRLVALKKYVIPGRSHCNIALHKNSERNPLVLL